MMSTELKPYPIQATAYELRKPRTIPRHIAAIVYNEYVKKYGAVQSFERLEERGGWGRDEVIDFLIEFLDTRFVRTEQEARTLTIAMEKNDLILHLEGFLASIKESANHQIPVYVYGDNEAACEMARRLSEIIDIAERAEEKLQEVV